jgi:hypothetical protein
MATMSIDYQTLKFDYRPRAARARRPMRPFTR